MNNLLGSTQAGQTTTHNNNLGAGHGRMIQQIYMRNGFKDASLFAEEGVYGDVAGKMFRRRYENGDAEEIRYLGHG